MGLGDWLNSHYQVVGKLLIVMLSDSAPTAGRSGELISNINFHQLCNINFIEHIFSKYVSPGHFAKEFQRKG